MILALRSLTISSTTLSNASTIGELFKTSKPHKLDSMYTRSRSVVVQARALRHLESNIIAWT
ncbi:hypothetical protein SERLA73DRAFT_142731 [Serpula lacrymans var. lacrymans S7.3]|uniref:Uncharacterized protein n=2 Tax=Serpula lacrymans var. lacrymans TaxID=341189 RepID=F8Q8A0_SERL3|nr:uncharacterized protein SERLADRAFT_398942 [Serpula lacrymans var. lacrymans S7.9]EGN95788.1 hypothetical protein SERLA73DRAFT_142731 [Serpula lacrymans var. lacrymans S7.3]EGO21309.1 hypothetical protein SERLADRAFT_398942 [Serpula lacrymans var. lacrymans S7.9]